MNFKPLLSTLLLSCLCVHGWCQESMLSSVSYSYLDKLIAIAQKNYPLIQAQANQVALSKNTITRVSVGYLQALSVSYYYQPHNSIDFVNNNLINGYQLGLFVNIGTLLQVPFATREAKIQYRIAQENQQEYSLRIVDEVKKRYFTYLQQMTQLKLRTRSLKDAQNLVNQLQHKFEKGETSFDDYSRSLLLTAQENQAMITAEGETLIAKAALEEILGEKLEDIN